MDVQLNVAGTPSTQVTYTHTTLPAASSYPVNSILWATVDGSAPMPFYSTGSAWKLCPGVWVKEADITDHQVTGNTTETILKSFKIPANLMPMVKSIRVKYLRAHTVWTVANIGRVRLHTSAAIAGTVYNQATISVTGSDQNETEIYNAGANSQSCYALSTGSRLGNSSGGVITSTLADNADMYVMVTGQCGAASVSVVNCKAAFLELIGG